MLSAKLNSIGLVVLFLMLAVACGGAAPTTDSTSAANSPGVSNSSSRASQNLSDTNPPAAGDSGGSSQGTGNPDLHGLERVNLPADRDAALALLKQLPPRAAGLAGQEMGLTYSYGPQRSIGRAPISIAVWDVRYMVPELRRDTSTADGVIQLWADSEVLQGDAFYKLDSSTFFGVLRGVEINGSGQDRDLAWVRFTSDSILNIGLAGQARNAFYRQEIHGLAWGRESDQWLYLILADSPELLDLGVQAFVAGVKGDQPDLESSTDFAALSPDDPSVWPGFTLYTPDLDAVPEAAAVAGLGDVPEIGENEELNPIFDRLPRELLGQGRFTPLFGPTNPTIYQATYGGRQGPQLNARRMARRRVVGGSGEVPEGWNLAQVVVDFVTGPGISDLEWGRDGNLVWALFTTSDGARTVYSAMWTTTTGQWLYRVSAPTPEARAALLEAWVDAAR